MSTEPGPFIKWDGHWVSSDTELGKEAQKWNKPYQYEHFPLMLYRVQRRPDNQKWSHFQEHPSRFAYTIPEQYDFACRAADAFTQSCQLIVRNEEELKRAVDSGLGWCETPDKAMEWRQKLEDQVAEAAAVRTYQDRNMSEKAKAEVAEAEAAAPFIHLDAIPEKPIRRRGRRPAA